MDHLEPMIDQPLSGLRITTTRSKHQSAELTDQLTRLGAIVTECPMIEIAPPSSWEALDSAIGKINTYDWLIFTSANAVGYFFARLKVGVPSGLKICAVGKATAARISDFGLSADLLPEINQSEGVFAALSKKIGQENLTKTRFLFPRAKYGRDYLIDELRKSGVEIDLAEAYQTIRPDYDAETVLNLLNHETDIIVFTSPSTVHNLAELIGNDRLRSVLQNIVVVCIGPTTGQAAIEKELSVSIQPENQSVEDLIESIIAFVQINKPRR
jgi:uroporphyrinogen III methyltransferase/synthase